jgi:VIT1/CCC1 family predicted Fe2+/Mn2+ transporter
MAIGANISSKSEIEHHRSEIKREEQEIRGIPEIEREEIRQIYMKKAKFTKEELDMVVNRTTGDEKTLLDSMIKEELGL